MVDFGIISVSIPNAAAAVLISFVVTFVRDNITPQIQTRLNKRRKEYEKKIDWLAETQAIGEQIKNSAQSANAEYKAIQDIEQNAIAQIREIDWYTIKNSREMRRKINSVDSIEVEFLDLTDEQIRNSHPEDLERYAVRAVEKAVEEQHYQPYSSRVSDEMYSYYKEMIEHYSYRRVSFDQELYDAYFELQHICHKRTMYAKITEEMMGEIQKSEKELYDICQNRVEELDKKNKLQNRLKRKIPLN